MLEIKNEQFKVHSVKKKERKRNPSPPFITSSLQQEAARKLNFRARKTMMIAQQLYEGIDLGKEGTRRFNYVHENRFNTDFRISAKKRQNTYIEEIW